MKVRVVNILLTVFSLFSLNVSAQLKADDINSYKMPKLYIDVHKMPGGKVNFNDVAGAHAKDLAVQKKHGVNFINYWVDEKSGVVMCLSQAKNEKSIRDTHKEAHGLLPAYIMNVKQGD